MRKFVPLALAAVAALAFSSVAVAGINSEIVRFKANQIDDTTVQYKGRIDSNHAECISGRSIVIKHNGVIIASTTTDKDGRFSVEGPKPPDGDKVTAKLLSSPNCEGDKYTRTYHDD